MGSVKCTLGGRLLLLLGRGARVWWCSWRTYFYSKLNQICSMFGWQNPGRGARVGWGSWRTYFTVS
jgi:hypothetical protein